MESVKMVRTVYKGYERDSSYVDYVFINISSQKPIRCIRVSDSLLIGGEVLECHRLAAAPNTSTGVFFVTLEEPLICGKSAHCSVTVRPLAEAEDKSVAYFLGDPECARLARTEHFPKFKRQR